MKILRTFPCCGMSTRGFLFSIVLLASSLDFVSAGQNENALIRWSGQYVLSLPQPRLEVGEFQLISESSGREMGLSFRPFDNEPMSPMERYDLDSPSAIFHGFFDVINPSAASAGTLERNVRHRCGVVRRAEDSFIRFGGEAPSANEIARLTGVVFWDHTGFLPGLVEGESIFPERVQRMEVEVIGINSRLGRGSFRFAVRADGEWFLSEEFFTRSGVASVIPGGTLWAKWEIDDFHAPLPEVPDSFPSSLAELPPIEAFGIYFDSVSGEQPDEEPASNAVFSFSSFEVEVSDN